MNNIIDNGETQIGKVVDMVEHLRNEISRQSLDKDNNIEELYYNVKLILDLLEDLSQDFTDLNEYEDTIIEVKYNPMGCYQYVKYKVVDKEEELKEWQDRTKNYLDMLERDTTYYSFDSVEKCKKILKEELEDIIAMNGYNELFDSEKELCKLVGIKEELK